MVCEERSAINREIETNKLNMHAWIPSLHFGSFVFIFQKGKCTQAENVFQHQQKIMWDKYRLFKNGKTHTNTTTHKQIQRENILLWMLFVFQVFYAFFRWYMEKNFTSDNVDSIFTFFLSPRLRHFRPHSTHFLPFTAIMNMFFS